MLYFCIFLFFQACCFGQENSEEALFVRRILEFWKDKEIHLVKTQIPQFLQQYPESSYAESLRVILGDLYWREKNFETALKIYEEILSPANREKVLNNRIDCLFQLGRYEILENELKLLLPLTGEPPQNNEQALRLYYYAAIKKQSEPEVSLPIFKTLMESSEELSKEAAFDRLNLLYEKGDYLSIIQEKDFYLPFCLEGNKTALFSLIGSAFQLKKGELVEEWGLEFERQFPKDPLMAKVLYLRALMWKLREQFQNAESIFEKIIFEHPTFDKIENVSFEIALMLFKQKKWEEALQLLQEYLQDHPNDYLGHLLLANCFYESQKDLEKFVSHAEKVLLLNPQFSERNKLKMNLFNAYLHLGTNLEKASDHLYEAIISHEIPIKNEQAIWLGNRFYATVKADEYEIEPLLDPTILESARRAVAIYETILIPFPEISAETISLEQELYKLSNLYGWLHNSKKQEEVLVNLIAQQNGKTLSWSLRSRSLLALANCYRSAGKVDLALENYALLLKNPKGVDPIVLNRAKLAWARLNFALLPKEKQQLENEDLIAILKVLKDLQIKKTAAQEPIHLEAALDYIRYRSSLEPLEKQDDETLFLLLRMKEDFSNKTDLWAKDYALGREKLPEKETLYQAYMLLVDAHILNLESKLAEKKGKTQEAEIKKESALSLYKSLCEGKLSVSKYLLDQAKFGLDELKNK